MKRQEKISLVLGVLVVVLLVGLGFTYYTFHQANLAAKESIIMLQNDLNATQEKYDLEFQMQRDLILSSESMLMQELEFLEEAVATTNQQQSAQIKSLSSGLSQLEVDSQNQLNELKSQVADINIQTESFSAIVDSVLKGIVSIATDKGFGSGVVVDERGYVITNYHVIDDISKMTLTTVDGERYTAKIVSYNIGADIAVLKITTDDDLYDLRFEDYEDVKVGQKVIALGNPLGLDFTVTEGIVSSVNRKNPSGYDVIQTDVPINPGNSGGPLVNAAGRIVGINTFKATGGEGLGFAMNPDTVREIVAETISQYEGE